MCANVVELSCNLVIMSQVTMSAKIPWDKIQELHGKVFIWSLDNIDPRRDPLAGKETPMIQKFKELTGATYVVGVSV